MKTTLKEENNNLVMYLEGRLDTAAATQVEKEMQPLHDCEGRDIILDCTQMSYIASSGLRIFLGLLKNAKLKGSHVYIAGLNDTVRDVFALTGFLNLFEYK